MHVLVVEDDQLLNKALSQILIENNYEVDSVFDGKSALSYALNISYDVVILDVMIPKIDGFHVVETLRRKGISTPVLLLTARDSIHDKINGYDSGADDYMTKPFSPAELLAHLRALTRRRGEVIFETVTVGNLVLNLETCDLKSETKSVHLSNKEFELAKILMVNSGQAISKETLIDKVWGLDSTAEDNNVEAYISFLRKKLRFLDSNCTIETIRQVGYRLNEN